MKLLRCNRCHDVFALILSDARSCRCGSVSGKYVDYINAVYAGENAVPLGFDSSSFDAAIATQPDSGWGPDFKAFVIAKKCPTFIRIDVPAGLGGLAQKMVDATTEQETKAYENEVLKSFYAQHQTRDLDASVANPKRAKKK